jgi:hypothetical protein
MTMGAFVTVARGDGIAVIVSATRTTKPFRPALLRQHLGAGCFRTVPFLPVQQIRFCRLHDSSPRFVDYETLGR